MRSFAVANCAGNSCFSVCERVFHQALEKGSPSLSNVFVMFFYLSILLQCSLRDISRNKGHRRNSEPINKEDRELITIVEVCLPNTGLRGVLIKDVLISHDLPVKKSPL